MGKSYAEMSVTELERELEESNEHLVQTGRALTKAKDALEDAERALDDCEHEAELARKDLADVQKALAAAREREGWIPPAEAEAGLADLCSQPAVVIGAAGPQAVSRG